MPVNARKRMMSRTRIGSTILAGVLVVVAAGQVSASIADSPATSAQGLPR